MADLSFRPDPEPAAPLKPDKPPHPPWVAGCKSGVLTVLSFLFLLVMLFVMCGGFLATNQQLQQMGKKIDGLQKDVNELKEQKPADKKAMPPAGD